jgi:hypothetical protein
MEGPVRFDPPRRRGGLLHLGLLLGSAGMTIALLTLATLQPAGPLVILLLIGALFLSLPLPFLFYRLYALNQSGYWVAREGVRLRWGLRQVDLPHEDILDIAGVDEVEMMLALPRLAWPGCVVGEVKHDELGVVEYLASEKSGQVLLGTEGRVYVISPRDPLEFVQVYKRESERGSLRSLPARSISPSFVLNEVWEQGRARQALVAGAVLAFGLLLLVGFLAPGLGSVSLGFTAEGLPQLPVSGVRLFLLPALNLFFYVGNLFLGLLFFRESKGATYSYLLWGSSLLTSFFFLGAVLFSL